MWGQVPSPPSSKCLQVPPLDSRSRPTRAPSGRRPGGGRAHASRLRALRSEQRRALPADQGAPAQDRDRRGDHELGSGCVARAAGALEEGARPEAFATYDAVVSGASAPRSSRTTRHRRTRGSRRPCSLSSERPTRSRRPRRASPPFARRCGRSSSRSRSSPRATTGSATESRHASSTATSTGPARSYALSRTEPSAGTLFG